MCDMYFTKYVSKFYQIYIEKKREIRHAFDTWEWKENYRYKLFQLHIMNRDVQQKSFKVNSLIDYF